MTRKALLACPRARGLAVLWLAFALSRALYYAAGLRFDASPLLRSWQFIDPDLMRSDLLRSLFYMHMQPPGYNLAVGLVVKVFPHSYTGVFAFLHLVLGVCIAVSLLQLMRLLGVREWLAVAITTLFIVSPGVVLYENFLGYEYPILLLLLRAALALFRFCKVPSSGNSLRFFGSILILTLIRNSFHLIYVVLLAAGLAWALPAARRAVVRGALPAVVVNLAVSLKNWILFGAFTSSTWMGMATGVTTTFQLTPDEVDRLVQQGVVTPLARITPYSPLSDYEAFIHRPPPSGMPVLDQDTTSGGHPNFNSAAYLQLHAQYLENSKAVLRHYPIAYVRSVLIAWFSYFLPPGDLHSFDVARARIRAVDRPFSAALYGQFRQADSRKDLRAIRAAGGTLSLVPYTGMYLIVMVPVLLLWGAAQLRRNFDQPQRLTLAFMLCTIVFLAMLSNHLSSFECNRYRFPVDAFYLVLLGMLLTRARLLNRTPRFSHRSNAVPAH